MDYYEFTCAGTPSMSVAIQTVPTAQNIEYLRTKREKLGHLLDVPEVVPERRVPS